MPDEQNPSDDNLKDLREAAGTSRANAEKAARAERENAFLRAGIDVDSKPAQALVQNYEGELTKEAIRKEATEWGLFKDESAPPAPPTDEQEQAAAAERAAAEEQQQNRALLNGGGGASTPPEKPEKGGIDQAKEDYVTARKSATPVEKALGLAMNNALAAGVAGDKQAKFDQDRWESEKAKAGHGAEYAH